MIDPYPALKYWATFITSLQGDFFFPREIALSGIGSATVAGRWNPLRTRMVYTAGSLALAVLEIRVHIPIGTHQLSARFVGIEMEIDDSGIEMVKEEDLPRGWRRAPKASNENTAARRFGKRLDRRIEVGSSQTPEQRNPNRTYFSAQSESQGFCGHCTRSSRSECVSRSEALEIAIRIISPDRCSVIG